MIPKFEIHYEHLHSDFIIFDNFLKFLKNEFINGFILAENNDLRTYFFLFEGELLSSFSISESQNRTKISLVRDSSIPKDCFLSAYRCPHKYVDYFSKFYSAKMVYNNVSTDKISPEKLFEKLIKESFTGFIERQSTDPSIKTAYIYFNKGELIGNLSLDNKNGHLDNELTLQGIRDKTLGALLNIYAFVSPAQTQEKDRTMILKCFQEIFQMMEARVNSSDFSMLWRKCAMELSEKYPFLDPLIGEFQYKNQKIGLYEKIDLKTAVLGLNDLVFLMAQKLSISKEDIMKIKSNYSGSLDAYEIRN